MFDLPEIAGTADRYINNLNEEIQAVIEDETVEWLVDKKYLTAVEMASGDDILRLQECIDIFDEAGDFKDSVSLREKCVNKVMGRLAEKNECEDEIAGTAAKRSKRISMKPKRFPPIVIICIAVFFIGSALLQFEISEAPDVPNGDAEFVYDSSGNRISEYGVYCANIDLYTVVFGYVTYSGYEDYDKIEEFAIAGTMCSDKEICNILKRQSILFEDGTKGWIGYSREKHILKIHYRGKTYLCKGY